MRPIVFVICFIVYYLVFVFVISNSFNFKFVKLMDIIIEN